MNRYIILYKAPLSVRQRLAQATPTEAQQGVQAWVDWQERVGDALIDAGRPVGRAQRVTAQGATDTGSAVVGMSILQAPTIDDAVALVADHHHLRWAGGCEIEVLEEMAIPELSGPSGA